MITCIAQGVSLGFIVSSSAFVPPIVLGCLRVLETSDIWPTGQKKCLHVRALLTQIFTTGGLSFRIDAILTFFMCCRKRNMWMQREDQFCFFHSKYYQPECFQTFLHTCPWLANIRQSKLSSHIWSCSHLALAGHGFVHVGTFSSLLVGSRWHLTIKCSQQGIGHQEAFVYVDYLSILINE